MKQYRVLTINPGSTSTKIALFEGENCLFSRNVAHDAQELAKFKTIPDQLPYREKTILDLLAQEDVDLSTVDVFVGRGGGLLAMEGGTYFWSTPAPVQTGSSIRLRWALSWQMPLPSAMESRRWSSILRIRMRCRRSPA